MSLALIVKTADVAHLPTKARQSIEFWLKILKPVFAHKEKGRIAFIGRYAETVNMSEGMIRKKYYALKNKGPMALLDKRLCGRSHWNTRKQDVSREAITLWKELVEKYKRKCKSAHDELVKMWIRKDVRLARIFPGFPGWPNLPEGLSYRNLMQKKYKPTEYERTLAHIGTSAARHMQPKVLTTRFGIEPGQIYMADDQDYDVNTAFVGLNTKMTRPSGFNCLDYSSACEVAFGIKPTLINSDGTKKKLLQIDYQWFLVHILTTVGYRADIGTLIIDENGTANAGPDFIDRVFHATDGRVVFDSSGIHGKQMPGYFRGAPHGNPGFKAARESWFNLLRNMMAAIAGQTGMDRHHAPEENYGLDKYVRDILTLIMSRPELADVLKLPVPRHDDFIFLVAQIVKEINMRYEHDLEGWDRMKRSTAMWRLDRSHGWMEESSYLALPPSKRLAVDAVISTDPELMKHRKLAPLEVWEASLHKLTRLSGAAIPMIIGPDGARPARVTDDHHIIIKDREIDSESMWYDSALTNGRIIEQGAPISVYLDPYDPARLQVCEPDGSYLGEAPIVDRIGKMETEAILRRNGRVNSIAAKLQAPVIQRARKDVRLRTDMIEHNARVAADLPITLEDKRTSKAAQKSAGNSLLRRAAALEELENL